MCVFEGLVYCDKMDYPLTVMFNCICAPEGSCLLYLLSQCYNGYNVSVTVLRWTFLCIHKVDCMYPERKERRDKYPRKIPRTTHSCKTELFQSNKIDCT